MKPISDEKRERLVAAKQRGEKEEDIAKWLGISKGSMGTIWRLFRKTGSFLPTKYTGRKSVITEKTTYPAAQDRPDVQEKRKVFQEIIKGIRIENLVSLDESSINLAFFAYYANIFSQLQKTVAFMRNI